MWIFLQTDSFLVQNDSLKTSSDIVLMDVETQLGDSKFWTYRIHPADWPVETAAPVPEMTDGWDGPMVGGTWRCIPNLGPMAKLIL